MSSGATFYSCTIEKLKIMYTLVWQNMCKNGIINTKGGANNDSTGILY